MKKIKYVFSRKMYTCIKYMYRIHNEMKKYIIIYNFKKVYFIIEKLKDHIKTLKNLIIINL